MTENTLEAAARRAAACAYIPYSGYAVGAALECEDGTVFQGCNVENAAYSPCLCAERNALGAAVQAGHRSFRRVFIVAGTDRPAAPCGVCRQMLFEFSPNMEVLATTLEPGGPQKRWILKDLLPDGFGPVDLGQEHAEESGTAPEA